MLPASTAALVLAALLPATALIAIRFELGTLTLTVPARTLALIAALPLLTALALLITLALLIRLVLLLCHVYLPGRFWPQQAGAI